MNVQSVAAVLVYMRTPLRVNAHRGAVKKSGRVFEAQKQDCLAQIERLKKESRQDERAGYHVGRWFMEGAEHGKGLIVTGGYDPKQIATVDDAQIRDGKTREDLAIEAGGSGHKKHYEGRGAAGTGDENNPNEKMEFITRKQWIAGAEFVNSETWTTEVEFVSSKKWITIFDNRRPLRLSRSNIHFLCPRHSFVEANTPLAFQDPETGAWIRTFFASLKRKTHVWEMCCGCTRPHGESEQKNIVTQSKSLESGEDAS